MNCLDGFNGKITNEKMRILLDVEHSNDEQWALNFMNSQQLGQHYKLKDSRVVGAKAYNGCCTSGPTTWYKRVGINLVFWNPKGVKTSNHEATEENMKKAGLKMAWHGTLDQATKLPNTSFRPGDVATFHVYKKSGAATSHGVMWTGKDWRSDCIQRALSCYPGGKDRDGNYSVCIWRHPDLQEPGLSLS